MIFGGGDNVFDFFDEDALGFDGCNETSVSGDFQVALTAYCLGCLLETVLGGIEGVG